MFFVDPHWNPALESQAFDRIYRIGQKKVVNIYKFLCSDTIETSIQKLQAKKIEIAESFVNAKASDILGAPTKFQNNLTVDDMKMLFKL